MFDGLLFYVVFADTLAPFRLPHIVNRQVVHHVCIHISTLVYLYLLGHVFLVFTIFIYNFFTQRMAAWLYAHVGTSQHVCHHTLHAILTHVGVRLGVAEKHCPGYNWLPQCTWSLRHAHRRPCKSDRPHQGGVHVSLPAQDRTLPP